MSAVASILTIILFLAFTTSGLQKVLFNPAMSHAAEHLGVKKSSYQSVGAMEIAGAVALVVGLAAQGSSIWAYVNEVAAGGLFLLMIVGVVAHLRSGDKAKGAAPAMALGGVALLELIIRVTL